MYGLKMHLAKVSACSDALYTPNHTTSVDLLEVGPYEENNLDETNANAFNFECDANDDNEEYSLWKQLQMWDTSSDEDSDSTLESNDDSTKVMGDNPNPNEFVSPPGASMNLKEATWYLTTVNSGAWSQKAYKNLIQDPANDFLLPICFAWDKTPFLLCLLLGICKAVIQFVVLFPGILTRWVVYVANATNIRQVTIKQ
jgi:hypothetical protein